MESRTADEAVAKEEVVASRLFAALQQKVESCQDEIASLESRRRAAEMSTIRAEENAAEDVQCKTNLRDRELHHASNRLTWAESMIGTLRYQEPEVRRQPIASLDVA